MDIYIQTSTKTIALVSFPVLLAILKCCNNNSLNFKNLLCPNTKLPEI